LQEFVGPQVTNSIPESYELHSQPRVDEGSGARSHRRV